MECTSELLRLYVAVTTLILGVALEGITIGPNSQVRQSGKSAIGGSRRQETYRYYLPHPVYPLSLIPARSMRQNSAMRFLGAAGVRTLRSNLETPTMMA